MDTPATPDRPKTSARSSIVVRLVAAFLIVGFLPIGVLAALSLQESAEPAAEHSEGGRPRKGRQPSRWPACRSPS